MLLPASITTNNDTVINSVRSWFLSMTLISIWSSHWLDFPISAEETGIHMLLVDVC